MKKVFSLLLSVLLLLSLCACGGDAAAPTTAPTAEPTAESAPANVYYNTKWDGKSLKVLCVGNSFARNATKVLYQIAQAHGVEEIVLGILYIGGCSVETHWLNAQSGETAYQYYKNTIGAWELTERTTMLYGLKDEDWDVITITQGQGLYGVPQSYDGCLEELIGYLNEHKTNPNAQVAFHMTWAFPKDSTIERFNYYANDQDVMFKCLADTARERILPTEGIDFLLPSGSAIQNARTVMGDVFSAADRFHLGALGEYVAGYSWFVYLTGQPIEKLCYIDDAVGTSATAQQTILDAVNAAFYDPFTVKDLTKQ